MPVVWWCTPPPAPPQSLFEIPYPGRAWFVVSNYGASGLSKVVAWLSGILAPVLAIGVAGFMFLSRREGQRANESTATMSPQRKLLIAMLIVAAVILHVSFCDWSFGKFGPTYDGFAGVWKDVPEIANELFRVPFPTGQLWVLRKSGLTEQTAWLAGVLVPVLLIGGAGFVYLGRREGRRANKAHIKPADQTPSSDAGTSGK